MNTYHIYHATGFHIVTVQATDDAHFNQMLDTGAIPEIKQYTYLQIYTQNNPNSTYPDISTQSKK